MIPDLKVSALVSTVSIFSFDRLLSDCPYVAVYDEWWMSRCIMASRLQAHASWTFGGVDFRAFGGID